MTEFQNAFMADSRRLGEKLANVIEDSGGQPFIDRTEGLDWTETIIDAFYEGEGSPTAEALRFFLDLPAIQDRPGDERVQILTDFLEETDPSETTTAPPAPAATPPEEPAAAVDDDTVVGGGSTTGDGIEGDAPEAGADAPVEEPTPEPAAPAPEAAPEETAEEEASAELITYVYPAAGGGHFSVELYRGIATETAPDGSILVYEWPDNRHIKINKLWKALTGVKGGKNKIPSERSRISRQLKKARDAQRGARTNREFNWATIASAIDVPSVDGKYMTALAIANAYFGPDESLAIAKYFGVSLGWFFTDDPYPGASAETTTAPPTPAATPPEDPAAAVDDDTVVGGGSTTGDGTGGDAPEAGAASKEGVPVLEWLDDGYEVSINGVEFDLGLKSNRETIRDQLKKAKAACRHLTANDIVEAASTSEIKVSTWTSLMACATPFKQERAEGYARAFDVPAYWFFTDAPFPEAPAETTAPPAPAATPPQEPAAAAGTDTVVGGEAITGDDAGGDALEAGADASVEETAPEPTVPAPEAASVEKPPKHQPETAEVVSPAQAGGALSTDTRGRAENLLLFLLEQGRLSTEALTRLATAKLKGEDVDPLLILRTEINTPELRAAALTVQKALDGHPAGAFILALTVEELISTLANDAGADDN